MGSFDKGASDVHRVFSFAFGAAVLGLIAYGVTVNGPKWYENRKVEAARAPGVNLKNLRSNAPRTYMTSKTEVEYTPNAKIIRTTVTQHNERGR